MRLNLKATNITVTPDTREYLGKRVNALERFIDPADPAVLVEVELGRTTAHHRAGDIFRAEINLSRGKDMLRAVAERGDLHAAIDEARDEMARVLSARKGRRESLFKRGGRIAKALLRGSYEGLGYMGRPVRAGWGYLRRMWRR